MYSDEYVAARLDQAMAEDPNCSNITEVLSPEVEAIVVRREAAAALKKSLESLTGSVEVVIKARVKLSKAEEDSRDTCQRAFNAAAENLDSVLQCALMQANTVDAGDEAWHKVMLNVAQQARSEMRTKKQLMVFSELIRKHAQELFKLQKAMLAEIKQLKSQATEGSPQAVGALQ